MLLYYLDYVALEDGRRYIHRFGCKKISSLKSSLLLGKCYCEHTLMQQVQRQFPTWDVSCCMYCCGSR